MRVEAGRCCAQQCRPHGDQFLTCFELVKVCALRESGYAVSEHRYKHSLPAVLAYSQCELKQALAVRKCAALLPDQFLTCSEPVAFLALDRAHLCLKLHSPTLLRPLFVQPEVPLGACFPLAVAQSAAWAA